MQKNKNNNENMNNRNVLWQLLNLVSWKPTLWIGQDAFCFCEILKMHKDYHFLHKI